MAAVAPTKLSFNITEDPEWRIMTTDHMITSVASKIDEISGQNIVAGAGDATEHEAKEARYMRHLKTCASIEGNSETKENIVNAMKVLRKYRKDMDGCFFLTDQMILDVHKSLMSGQIENAGEYRQETDPTNPLSYAHTTRPDGSTYTYSNPFDIECSMRDVCDAHCANIEWMRKHNFDTKDKVTYLIKCAAFLFCRTITVHPFSDGNGRLCRLLANDVLLQLMPVPIPLYNIIPNITKDTYFQAIMEYQDRKSFSLFAALLVYGLYHAYENYTREV